MESIIATETSLHPPIIHHITYPGTEHEGRFQSQTQPLPPWSGRVEDANLTEIRGVLTSLTEGVLALLKNLYGAKTAHLHCQTTKVQKIGQICVQDIPPYVNRGPEIILGYEWTTKTDVWGFACLVSINGHQDHA
jgi:hypothetical protein